MSEITKSPEDWLTPVEAAPILRCGVDQVWKLCRERKLKHRRNGNRILIKRVHLTEYTDAQVVGA
jgi:excisionase family DNA binding protein